MLAPSHVAGLAAAADALERVVVDRLARRRGEPADDWTPVPSKRCYADAGPLRELADACDLDAVDLLLIVAALAPRLDGRFRSWYRQLDGCAVDVGLTVETARALTSNSLGGRLAVTELLRPDGPLCSMGIVELAAVGADLEVSVTEDIADFILGFRPIPPQLSETFPAVPMDTLHDRASLVVRSDIGALLDQIASRIRFEQRVTGDWDLASRFDHVGGLVALLHGPPGTGKSLAAAVLAKEAGMAAYRVDMQACVSKYIGETQKQLEKVFRRAEQERCLLFFDEADTFFGKRTEVSDARDRHANHDVSYLLQRVEQHPGVVILATNMPTALDDAFQRRIDVQIEFVAPGRAERLQLWKGALPDALPLGADIDLSILADRYELTGGEIRNAVLDAVYSAAPRGGPVDQSDFVAGIAGQFAKSGRMMPSVP